MRWQMTCMLHLRHTVHCYYSFVSPDTPAEEQEEEEASTLLDCVAPDRPSPEWHVHLCILAYHTASRVHLESLHSNLASQ